MTQLHAKFKPKLSDKEKWYLVIEDERQRLNELNIFSSQLDSFMIGFFVLFFTSIFVITETFGANKTVYIMIISAFTVILLVAYLIFKRKHLNKVREIQLSLFEKYQFLLK